MLPSSVGWIYAKHLTAKFKMLGRTKSAVWIRSKRNWFYWHPDPRFKIPLIPEEEVIPTPFFPSSVLLLSAAVSAWLGCRGPSGPTELFRVWVWDDRWIADLPVGQRHSAVIPCVPQVWVQPLRSAASGPGFLQAPVPNSCSVHCMQVSVAWETFYRLKCLLRHSHCQQLIHSGSCLAYPAKGDSWSKPGFSSWWSLQLALHKAKTYMAVGEILLQVQEGLLSSHSE